MLLHIAKVYQLKLALDSADKASCIILRVILENIKTFTN